MRAKCVSTAARAASAVWGWEAEGRAVSQELLRVEVGEEVRALGELAERGVCVASTPHEGGPGTGVSRRGVLAAGAPQTPDHVPSGSGDPVSPLSGLVPSLAGGPR